jgi:hypothetical protein
VSRLRVRTGWIVAVFVAVLIAVVLTTGGKGETGAGASVARSATLVSTAIPSSAADYTVSHTRVISVPVTVRLLAAQEDTFTETVASSGVYGDSDWLATGLYTNDYGKYRIERSYLEATLPVDGQAIEQLSLSLAPCARSFELHGALPAPAVEFYAGVWDGSLTTVPQDQLWEAWDGEVVLARYEAGIIYEEDCDTVPPHRQTIALNLDGADIGPDRILRLAIRDSEDLVDLRPEFASHSRIWWADPRADVWLEIVASDGGAP